MSFGDVLAVRQSAWRLSLGSSSDANAAQLDPCDRLGRYVETLAFAATGCLVTGIGPANARASDSTPRIFVDGGVVGLATPMRPGPAFGGARASRLEVAWVLCPTLVVSGGSTSAVGWLVARRIG